MPDEYLDDVGGGDYDSPEPAPPKEYPPGEIPTGHPFDGNEVVPMTMSEFIGYLENLARMAKQAIGRPPEGQFFCVVVPATGRAKCHSHPSVEALVEELRGLYGQETQVFAFNGQRLAISKGGQYLFTPWGQHALFVHDPAAEPDDEGFMGDAPQLVQPPPPPAPEEDDDGDDDEDDEA